MKIIRIALLPALAVISLNAMATGFERLDRGLVAVRQGNDVVLSWRALGSDGKGATYKVYRDGKCITPRPMRACWFKDQFVKGAAKYHVVAFDAKGAKVSPAGLFALKEGGNRNGSFDIPIDCPPPGETPDGEKYTYIANEASIGDLDGDGEFEIVLKWEPTNAKDPSQAGYTGHQIFDAYKLSGKRLWRIDMGPNIRAGSHYTQFLVWDFDGDGKAEVMMKTADGTIDGTGRELSLNKGAEFVTDEADLPQTRRERKIAKRGERRADGKMIGRILDGPEYLVVFEGATGKALKARHYKPPRGRLLDWGDNYGNRCDRFLAAIAYLDGVHPSAVFCRGYYGRSVLWAVDFDGKRIQERWLFDSDVSDNEKFGGQGNHNLVVADVDGDGKDEIIYGQMVVDDDGNGLYSTGRGHGDRIAATRMSKGASGPLVFCCLEESHGVNLRDAKTGKELWYIDAGRDCEPAVCGDFDPTNPGFELWAGGVGWLKLDGTPHRLGKTHVGAADKSILWKGDLVRSLLGSYGIFHYDPDANDWKHVLSYDKGVMVGHKLKASPVFVGDFLGDWREEVVMRLADQSALRVYVSTEPTSYRFRTFLENRQYRIGLALFNIGYNVTAFPSYYFGPENLR